MAVWVAAPSPSCHSSPAASSGSAANVTPVRAAFEPETEATCSIVAPAVRTSIVGSTAAGDVAASVKTNTSSSPGMAWPSTISVNEARIDSPARATNQPVDAVSSRRVPSGSTQ